MVKEETREKLILIYIFVTTDLIQDRELNIMATWWLVVLAVFRWPWALRKNPSAPVRLYCMCTFLNVSPGDKGLILLGIRHPSESCMCLIHFFDIAFPSILAAPRKL